MTMPSRSHPYGIEEILSAVSIAQGQTTVDGNVGGTTLFCGTLIGSNDYLTGKTMLLVSGNSIYEDRPITVYNAITKQVTVFPAFSGQVRAGTAFYVLNGISGMWLGALVAQIAKLAGNAPVANSVIANWGAGEQTLFTYGAAGVRYKVHSLNVDILATGGNITIRMYIAVFGNQRMIFPPKPVTWNKATDATAVPVINGTWEIANVMRVTCQSDAPGDNGVAIPYEIATESM